MKLSDIFSRLGNIELVKLLRWYGYCVVGVIVSIIAIVFVVIVAQVAYLAFTTLPWYIWVMIVVVSSGFMALHFTEPDTDDGYFLSIPEDKE